MSNIIVTSGDFRALGSITDDDILEKIKQTGVVDDPIIDDSEILVLYHEGVVPGVPEYISLIDNYDEFEEINGIIYFFNIYFYVDFQDEDDPISKLESSIFTLNDGEEFYYFVACDMTDGKDHIDIITEKLDSAPKVLEEDDVCLIYDIEIFKNKKPTDKIDLLECYTGQKLYPYVHKNYIKNVGDKFYFLKIIVKYLSCSIDNSGFSDIITHINN